MAAAPKADIKRLFILIHGDRFVVAAVDGQFVPVFDAAIGRHVHLCRARRAAGAHRERKAQRAIQAAWRRIFGITRLNGVYGNELRALHPKRRSRARCKRRPQRSVQLRAVAPEGRRFHARLRIFKIVGIILDHAVAEPAAPHVLRGFRLAAVRIAVIAGYQRVARVQRIARSGLHGLDHARLAAVQSLEHLIRGRIRNVVALVRPRRLFLEHIIARRHGLRLQRFRRTGIGHFPAHHAAKIILDIDTEHRFDRPARRRKRQISLKTVCHRWRSKAERAIRAAAAKGRTLRAVYAHAAAGHRQHAAGHLRPYFRARWNVNAGLARKHAGTIGLKHHGRIPAEPRELHAHCAVGRRQRGRAAPDRQQRQHQQQRRRAAAYAANTIIPQNPRTSF